MRLTRRALMIAAAGAGAGCAANEKKDWREIAPAQELLVDPDRMPDSSIPLWPDGPPGRTKNAPVSDKVIERENNFGLRDRALVEIASPRLDVFKPAEPNGSAILIAPGGGYARVVVDKEGYEGARLFSLWGATVYVLFYRLPHQGWAAGPDTPLQDAQRAMRIIRGRAQEDTIDPAKITAMGFSAGGHVAGSLATRFREETYAPVDDTDSLSARPDRAALIYPVTTMKAEFGHGGSRRHLLGETPDDGLVEKYSLETAPPPDAPPVFFLHAADDDSVPVENTTRLFHAFKSAGVSTEMHVFPAGGHGFGLRGIEGSPLRQWPGLARNWAASLDAI